MTAPRDASVSAFLDAVPDARRREDAKRVAELMAEITGQPATLWGPSMIGFGRYHYTYDSGHSGQSFLAGFSPRSANLAVYILAGFDGAQPLLARLGKYKIGKSCLYLKSLDGVDMGALRALIEGSVATMKARYGAS